MMDLYWFNLLAIQQIEILMTNNELFCDQTGIFQVSSIIFLGSIYIMHVCLYYCHS